jgi:hypothetical protein
MGAGKRLAPQKGRFFAILGRLGVTNCLGFLLVFLLLLGLAGGFILAVLSIKYQYTGALACWTVVFTPIGTAVSIVLVRIVDKSRAENTGPGGEGIKYAAAKANNFTVPAQGPEGSVDSPAI